MHYKVDLSNRIPPTKKMNPRLLDAEVANILDLISKEVNIEKIANIFNCSVETVYGIWAGRKWKKLKRPALPKKLRIDNKTGMIGVSKHKNEFLVKCQKNGKRMFKAIFDNIIDAAHHYDYYKLKYSTGFRTNLNFPNFDYSNFQPTK